MSVRLIIQKKGGSLNYRLVHPNGEVRWDDGISQGLSSNQTRTFEPIVGQWPLEMDTLDLNGGYDVCCQATRVAILAPPDSEEPASAICAEVQGDVVAMDISSDVPSPRCVKATSGQMIEVYNRTQLGVQLSLGFEQAQVDPGGAYRFEHPASEFLQPGVHVLLARRFSGPEIWLVRP